MVEAQLPHEQTERRSGLPFDADRRVRLGLAESILHDHTLGLNQPPRLLCYIPLATGALVSLGPFPTQQSDQHRPQDALG